MPFDRKYDELYGTIKEELTNLSLLCYRDDEIIGTEPFMNKVITNILLARYVIVIITDYRPNVLYELGIAHSFKDIQNVLIIVEKDAKLKSPIHQNMADISHLTYIEYDVNNLIQLRSKIKKFIEENKTYADFQDALNSRNLIKNLSENENKYIEYLQSKLTNKLSLVTSIILHNLDNLSIDEVENILILFENIIQQAYLDHKEDYIDSILIIYSEVLGSCSLFQSAVSEVFLNRF
jgi:hypothetical protein